MIQKEWETYQKVKRDLERKINEEIKNAPWESLPWEEGVKKCNANMKVRAVAQWLADK